MMATIDSQLITNEIIANLLWFSGLFEFYYTGISSCLPACFTASFSPHLRPSIPSSSLSFSLVPSFLPLSLLSLFLPFDSQVVQDTLNFRWSQGWPWYSHLCLLSVGTAAVYPHARFMCFMHARQVIYSLNLQTQSSGNQHLMIMHPYRILISLICCWFWTIY